MDKPTPYTPESLMLLAAQAESRYLSLLAEHPPGTIHDGRNAARREMEEARICADWMRREGLTQLVNVGPFKQTIVTRGQRVRIKAGSRVYGTSNDIPREGVVLQRAQTVLVHDVYKGYVTHRETIEQSEVVQPLVHWSGAGAYWKWTDLNNVEAVL